MRFLYQVDAADNLFPSIHCLTSWFCYIGIRGRVRAEMVSRIFLPVCTGCVHIDTDDEAACDH